MKSKFLARLIAVLSLASCRSLVLENRINCPRFLFFDLENGTDFHSYDNIYVTVYNHPEGRLLNNANTTVGEVLNREFYFEIKGEKAVKGYGIIGNKNQELQNDSEWIIPIGMDSDPLFRFSYVSETQEESFYVPVEFVKDYSHVVVRFVGMETFDSAEGQFPFEVFITSNTCGIEALSGKPIRGRFEYSPEEINYGKFEMNLPRQADRSLRLTLSGKPGVYDAPDYMVPFDLWAMLFDQWGVTWEEKNLPDIEVLIDYQEMKVEVMVTEWGEENLNYEF